MSFVLQGFATVSDSANTSAPRVFSYTSSTDAIATIVASAYFNSVAKSLQIGDLIYVRGTDTTALYRVTAVTPNVTLTASTVADASITLAKLSAGITPSHIVKFAGTQANGGGSATIAITVTGLTTSHICFAQIQASTNAVTVQKVTPTANTLTVVLSGDPGASTIIAYQALLAAA